LSTTFNDDTSADRQPVGEFQPAGQAGVRELLRMFNRRKWQLLGIALVVVLLTAAILSQLRPEYRSTALLMLDTRKMKVTNVSDVMSGLLTGSSADVAAMQTEIEVLRSASLLGRVVDKLRLDLDPEFGAAKPGMFRTLIRQGREFVWAQLGLATTTANRPVENTPRARAIAALTQNMVIAPRGRSYVISVSTDSFDPQKAKRITDTITDSYIVDQLDAKLEANKRATEWLNERLSELKTSVNVAERAVASFREKTGLTLAKDSTVFTQSLTELNSQLIQARGQRADKESRLVALQQGQKNPQLLGSISEVLQNSLISSLRGQESEVARRVADLGQRYGDSHPRLVQARAELGQIQGRIGAEVAKIMSSVQADAEAAKSKENELQAQVTALEQQAGGMGQNETGLRQLEREAVTTRTVYEDFLKRFKELSEQQDIQQPDARVLSPAEVPSGANFPRYGITLGVAGVLGLLLGIGVVLLIERLDGGFRTGDQVERMVGRPVVGMIPALSSSVLGKLTPARYAVTKPATAYAEALRSAYTAITLGSLDSPPRIIMVTSGLPDEGKSTFTASLAALLAKSAPDKKVIVVDCDLRRSSIAESLSVERPKDTIEEYLSGQKTLEEVVKRDEVSNVFLISAKRNTLNATELLGSQAMHRFVNTLASNYDVVFLDTPPVMAVADTRVIIPMADYVIFLIRWERTPRELASNALKLMRDMKKRIGVVLSQVDIRRHARYGYGDYGYYYSRYRSYYTRQ
jgi:succinoglycan biosynthesis transport protein ExoP